MRDLTALPKGHLHVHLEGAMRPSTLAELAGTYGMAVPVVRGYGSFPAFSQLYRAACQVLRTWDDMRRLVREVVEDAHAAGAVWVEPQTYPLLHLDRLGSGEEVVELILEEGLRAAADLGIGFGFMPTGDRTVDPAETVELARLAARYADRGVVSFGLSNDEAPWPPEPFREAFDIARAAGLVSAPHAGELAGPASVRGALDALGAERIAHGVRAIEDPELVARLVDEGVCLDVCPTSNVMLSVVPDLASHPLPALLAAGVRCSINGDDPLLFGPGLLEEYELARGRLGLSDEDLAFVARCSIEATRAPAELKERGLAGVRTWLQGGAA